MITKVNGEPVPQTDIDDLISGMSPGDTVTLEVYRGKDHRQVKVTLATRRAPI